jgi:hypothetical protein
MHLDGVGSRDDAHTIAWEGVGTARDVELDIGRVERNRPFLLVLDGLMGASHHAIAPLTIAKDAISRLDGVMSADVFEHLTIASWSMLDQVDIQWLPELFLLLGAETWGLTDLYFLAVLN